MQIKYLKIAIKEARKFLLKAKELEKEGENPYYSSITGSRLSGEVRRQSMELTNALSDLRNKTRD